MAKLLVKDKNGVEREMTQRSFDLAGSKRGWKIIGKVETPAAAKSEVQKIMDAKIAERAAQQVAKEEPKEEVVKVNKGGRPKLNKTTDEA